MSAPLPAQVSKDEKSEIEQKEGSGLSQLEKDYNAIPVERRAEIEKHIKKKLDRWLFPILVFFYIMNYIDRNALPNARLDDVEGDLGMSDTEFATAVSILYVGYLLMQIPSNLMLSIFRPSLYLPIWMIVWGIVSALGAVAQTSIDMIVIRLFLAFTEAPFFPGAIYLLSSWYTRRELALRTAILYSGSLVSSAFGALISLGIIDGMGPALGIAGWRWQFIILGAVTVAGGIVAIFIMPDYPHNTKWFVGEDRVVAQFRLVEDYGQEDSGDASLWVGFKLMVRDWRVYLFGLQSFGALFTASFTNFYPTIMATLGFSRAITYLLIAPPYFAAFFSLIFFCRLADKQQKRYIYLVVPYCISAVMMIILAATLNIGARYFALVILTMTIYIAFNNNIAWISSTLPRPRAKRAAALAAANMIGNMGNFAGSYLYPDEQGPRYWQACAAQGGVALGAAGCATILRFFLVRENKKLDRLEQEGFGLRHADGEEGQSAGIDEQGHIVARKDKFRYTI